MEAPEPTLTVQTVQPAFFSRPGPVFGSGNGVFQPALAGKYFLSMNFSRSDIAGTRSSSVKVGNCNPQFDQAAEVLQPVPSSYGSIIPAPGCAPASLMEAPNPLISVEPFLPASYSHPGPEYEHGEGVFQTVTAGKYTFISNYRVPDPCKISSQPLHYRFKINNCEPAPSQPSSQLVYYSHSSPGVPAPGCMPASSMEAPNPLISVEPVLPASYSHPGPEFEHGEGVFQSVIAGKYQHGRNSSSPERLIVSSHHASTNQQPDEEATASADRTDSSIPSGLSTNYIVSHSSAPIAGGHAEGMLSVYYQNVRGLRTKIPLLRLALSSCDYDVLVITETWLKADIENSEISSDYAIFRCD